MIGNAHIDPVWLWQWQEGFHEVKATFRSALDRMRETPGFIFVSSSAAFYEWVEQSDPGMFAEIRQRVQEGRWEVTGGWWIQPDCNLPGGESFVRQALYGQRYFKEKFGVTAKAGYNVDSFGHHGMLPQILKKSGLDYYVFMRPSPHEKGLPGRLFWWESDDGSRVLAFRIPYEYCIWGPDLTKHVEHCTDEIHEPFAEMMCFYGVGNHGGGPTRENLESIRLLNQSGQTAELVFSSPNRYFARAERADVTLPVVHDDLQHHASGCYAAHSGIKRWNRQAENRLLAAEKLSAVAAQVTRLPYPTEYGRAWKDVLFNQFHDILAGTSLEAAYEDAHHLYGEAMAIAGRGLNGAIQSLAWNIRTLEEPDVRPLVVFNPHAWPVRAPVELETGGRHAGEELVDPDGNPVPVQRLRSSTTTTGRHKLAFVCDLPAFGYRLYRLRIQPQGAAYPNGEMLSTKAGTNGKGDVRRGGIPAPFASLNRAPAAVAATLTGGGLSQTIPGAAASLTDGALSGNSLSTSLEEGGRSGAAPNKMGITAADTVLENHRFRLEIDPHSGFIRSLRDKQEDTQVFAGEAARPVVIDDPSDTWGHNVLRFDREVGCFEPASIRCTESGPVRAAIRVESRWGASSLVQEFILHADLDRIDVRVTVDWRETQKMLKLRFPVNVNMMKATHEIPYGTIVRSTNGDEEPGQTWIDLSGVSRDTGKLYGMSLLNDGKYSFNVTLRDIGLTVLRSPIYAHHIPEEPVSGESYSYMDQGIQHFQYTLLPHAGSLVQAGTVRRAAELNQPPVALFGTFHPGGTLPQAASFLSIDRENVVVSVVKQAEDGNGWIVRAYETAGQAVEAEIDLPAWKRQIHARFGPSEIKTFLIPQDPERPVVETNLLEWID